MSIVDDPIEDGVGQGWISDKLMPLVDGELAGNDGRGPTEAIIHNF